MSCVLSTTLETASATALPAKGRPRLSRAAAFRSVFEVLEAHGDDVVHAGQLAKEVGVSPASLQRMFLERFGVPPSRYLIMRRHHLARQRLRSGAAPSVTDAASSLGFWDMSRFAKTYRSLFGEYPSDTLRKSRG